ncbi:SpoIIIAH-like family protein [Metallumcola ferriviriculae]|uniref:SpoIIIAH-like family protein n=1 Tax=Metallumcola ferriviriculae TaxID=3039180 RepID=A0AAU0UUY7_9FIRM|nr:SpoIIIAH-like family protein [Desulfitibacteraceae bacterium MK1]
MAKINLVLNRKKSLWIVMGFIVLVIALMAVSGGFKLASSLLNRNEVPVNTGMVPGDMNDNIGGADANAKVAPLDENYELLEQVDKLAQGDKDFFVEYRLERDRVRSQQIELLKDIIQNPSSVAETRQEAQAVLLEITRRMEKELQLEHLITAKGYEDAVLFIQPSGVTVIVKNTQLSQEDVTKIADVVSRSTGHDIKDIVVIPKKD